MPGLRLTFSLMNAEGMVILFSDWNDFNPVEVRNLQPGTHVFAIRTPPRRILGVETFFLFSWERMERRYYP